MIKVHVQLSPSSTPRPVRRPWLLAGLLIMIALPIAATASPLDIPNSFANGDLIEASDFNDNFEAIEDAVDDNDARITDLENAVDGLQGAPSGTVSFFNLAACPDGWTEMTGMRGRIAMGLPNGGTLGSTVGIELDDEGTRTISQVPSHTHAADPPSTASASSGSHTHMADPDSFSVGGGSHTHVVRLSSGTSAANGHIPGGNPLTDASVADSSAPLSASTHNHDVNVPPFQSDAAGSHVHNVNIGSFTTGSTGSATVDVTMPYMQLLACSKN